MFRLLGRILVVLLFLTTAACQNAHRQNSAAATATAPAAKRAQRRPDLPPNKPNILIVVIDTLRYDATQLDPESKNATPFLASLRQRGVNFTHCDTPEDSTPPAHFSLLTGYLSGWTGPLDVPQASLAYQLKRQGYYTFGVAANSNLTPAAFRAVTPFDDYVCLTDAYNALPSARRRAANKRIDATIRSWGDEPNRWDEAIIWSSIDEVVARARQRLLVARQPFFGFLNVVDPHDPYYPDLQSYDRSGEHAHVQRLRFRSIPNELQHPETISDADYRALVTRKLEEATGRAWSTDLDLTKAQVEVYRRRYLAEVRQVDRALKGLFDTLAERGLLESTIVIITADHGESFGEHHLMTHSFANRGDLEATNHVPLLILFPRSYGIRPATVPLGVTLVDIPPMIYNLLGIDYGWLARKSVPANYGHSILPYMTSAAASRQAEADETWTPLDPTLIERQNDEARQRLKSLGYVQ